MVGKNKNRRRAAELFKNLSYLLQRKAMEIATFLPIAAGLFCLISYWSMVNTL
jgi:hypothetical protein